MIIENLIKENPLINLTVNAEDLMNFGEKIADRTARTILDKKEERIFSRKEVMEKFGICSATLWRWEKMNLIESKKIGNRKFYPESEIERLLTLNEEAK